MNDDKPVEIRDQLSHRARGPAEVLSTQVP